MTTSNKDFNKVAGAIKAKALPPFSIRLTVEERAELERAAVGLPLGAFVRERLFGSDLQPRRTRGKHPVKDHEALGRALALLGASRLSSNLNQLAKAVNTGSLPVTPETEKDLLSACEAVAEMRAALMQALSIRQGYSIDVAHDLVIGFSGGTAEITSIQASDQGIVVLALMRDAHGNIITPPADSLAVYTTDGERLCFEEEQITIATTTTQPMGSAPVGATALPMTFAILLDRSGSMSSVMDEVKHSAHRFIDALPSGATCAVGAFAAGRGMSR